MKYRVAFILAVVLSLLLVSFGSVAAQPPDEVPGLERAIQVKDRYAGELLETGGVVGVGVGNNSENNPAIIVFTDTPGAQALPATIEEVPVVVRYSGTFYAQPKPTKPPKDEPDISPSDRFDRPVPIGVSTGHPAITAGTIGARVTDGTNVYALSNNHVYADENNASKGDAVIQPGTYDGGTSPDDNIGTLYDFVQIDFAGTNYVDAAIALSSLELLGNATPADGYGAPQSDIIGAAIGMKVLKYGRTTGQTKGRISAINATVRVQYDSGIALFENQIIITPGDFSAGGDSGSLIVVNNSKSGDHLKPVGLLFAGSSLYTIANPIDLVLGSFGVTIDGQ